jgi:hypothetical protein
MKLSLVESQREISPVKDDLKEGKKTVLLKRNQNNETSLILNPQQMYDDDPDQQIVR